MNSILWELKYKPKKLSEISARDGLINRLNSLMAKGNIPHLMFIGPKGFGKLTTAILFAKQLLGDSYSSNCKIVFASDPLTAEERAQVKQESYVSTKKVGSMAGKKFTWPAFLASRIKPFVEVRPIGSFPYKILIVKDFHILESEQQGFRRLMEKYSETCRMILITDQISSIIDPILSRCMLFFFNEIDYDPYRSFIQKVADKEGLKIEERAIKYLYIATNGRIGESLNILQKIALKKDEISEEEVFHNIKNPIKLELQVLLRSILFGNMELLKTKLNIIQKFGYDLKTILAEISNEIFNQPLYKDQKAYLINYLGDLDFQSINGQDEELQLNNIIYQIIAILKN
ncbi:MAG: hypothetical protein ACTSRZ_13320 [Promethearchaeota archaeon]